MRKNEEEKYGHLIEGGIVIKWLSSDRKYALLNWVIKNQHFQMLVL